jgi:hypothetical protein
MQERALFNTRERALHHGAYMANKCNANMYCEARAIRRHQQVIGYEAWYLDTLNIMQPVYEHEV